MEHDEYRKMYELEDGHWWYIAKRRITLAMARPHLHKKARVLDVGCGTGVIMDAFAKEAGFVEGIDFSKEALKFCRKRGLKKVFVADLEKPLPKRLGTYDVIVATDIVEHLRNDVGALKRLQALLKPDGVIIVSVPAYQWMWSAHDVALHHYRRYTLPRLRQVMKKAGYEPLRLTYTNFFIFPITAIIRLVKRFLGADSGTDDGIVRFGVIAKILLGMYRVEEFLLRFIRLPFGVSVLCVARKKR